MYESDHTRFIKELLERKPDLPQKQREGRGLLWDKSLDQELYQGFSAARILQPAYVYQNQARPEQET